MARSRSELLESFGVEHKIVRRPHAKGQKHRLMVWDEAKAKWLDATDWSLITLYGWLGL